MATSTLPAPVRLFAEYQPFTPIIDTLRWLLVGASGASGGSGAFGRSGGPGSPVGHDARLAVAWCVAATLIGFAWSRRSFQRRR